MVDSVTQKLKYANFSPQRVTIQLTMHKSTTKSGNTRRVDFLLCSYMK